MKMSIQRYKPAEQWGYMVDLVVKEEEKEGKIAVRIPLTKTDNINNQHLPIKK